MGAAGSLVAELTAVVGPAHVLVDADLRAPYEHDWSGHRYGECVAAVRPADTGEVAEVLRRCRAVGRPVVVQGGNTGLVGGGVPSGDEVVLSTRRLTGVGAVDAGSGTVTVGAGTTLASVQEAVRPYGVDVGVDLAARDSATVGGMVATDAGGLHVLRHGTMRAQVVSLQAVLADGTVVDRLGAPVKAGSGYDLGALLVGSEGTLAVVTGVRLRLVERLRPRSVALLGLDGVAAAVDALAGLRAAPSLSALELVDAAALATVRERAGLPAPLGGDHGAYLLVECAAPRAGAARDDLTDALMRLGSEDAVVADDEPGCRELWRYREELTVSLGPDRPVKLDVAVPLHRLAAFVDELPGLVSTAAGGAHAVVFGHLAEGNLHLNVVGVATEGDVDRVTDAVLRRVAAEGGSISAEHGVGRTKRRWLALSRSADELRLMAGVKRVLDPDGLLGRGVLLPEGLS